MQHLLSHFKELTVLPQNAEELKGLILQLAVQGKLTKTWREENPDVEPASVLLAKIKDEKEQLIKQNRIKKEKALADVEYENDVPENWKPTRLGEIGDWGAGATPLRSRPEFYGGEINWFKSGELNNGTINYDSKEKINELALKGTSLRMNKVGDVLIAMYGATIGKTGILEVEGTTNQAVCACTPFTGVYNRYLHLNLRALNETFTHQGEGGAQPNISRVKIRNQAFLLPPLEEQKAIVSIVNQLLAEVEQLEAATKERVRLKEDFVSSALRRLTEGDTSSEWAALQPHFKTFFTETQNIKSLRESILQLAVQGKLTQHWRRGHPELVQGENSARALLERIKAEKAQLIADKKIKKEKPLPPITEDEIPYDLPEGWEWCRFQDIVINRDGERRPITKASRVAGPYDYYGASGVIDKVEGYLFEKDLLLIGEDGANLIARSTPIAFFARGKYWVNNHAHVLDSPFMEVLEYLEKYINAINLEDYITGMAQPKMPQKRMNLILIALPSLEEQQAIVQKVNALMGLCDQLEKEIETRTSTLEEWMKSCLKTSLEPKYLVSNV